MSSKRAPYINVCHHKQGPLLSKSCVATPGNGFELRAFIQSDWIVIKVHGAALLHVCQAPCDRAVSTNPSANWLAIVGDWSPSSKWRILASRPVGLKDRNTRYGTIPCKHPASSQKSSMGSAKSIRSSSAWKEQKQHMYIMSSNWAHTHKGHLVQS